MPYELALRNGYNSRSKNPEIKRFRAMTPAEALTQRGEMYFSDPTLTTFRRCRTNGAPKTWKTRPDVELPVKYGLKECARAVSEGSREDGVMRLPSGGLLLVEVAS